MSDKNSRKLLVFEEFIGSDKINSTCYVDSSGISKTSDQNNSSVVYSLKDVLKVNCNK